MTTKKTNDKKGHKSFEASLERLEKIVVDMEGGKLSLEEMINRFEEGQSLVKLCGEKLNEVERKIEILVKKGDEISTEPFATDDAGGSKGTEDSGEIPEAELF
ncbi:MAG: exodeoxyribonuclease VII small subunit [Kiritimatiellia bacterium]|jgi:exodeoxyribonuclease VII small subunit|nr:exodeoxyribonuclease VII small subunit [Kiritimatiellia bacterium]MDP6848142.1 exodeoxyribonuclease VII small subunit [Kiritimatiellia bacterium]